jgi:D-tyrosyl-tRNA(Tyr) deacylase
MIALIQRVKTASVTVSNETVSTIGNGMLIFLGVAREDTEQDAEKTAEKIVNLRMFEDSTGKMNISIRETKGEILVVSQFTLVANLKGGRRPDFFPAMEPVGAEKLYRLFTEILHSHGIPVSTGRYASHMEIQLTNDGPVTFVLDSKKLS